MPSHKETGGRVSRLAAVLIAWTSIAEADVVLDSTLGGGGALAGPDFVIDAVDGRTVGTNLFHSFSEFNLSSSQSATFTNSTPATINNVLGRITDTNPSSIDGRIASTIPSANLFLMNPNGFLFGPNATLDVQGAFHATTADYIGLADGTRFNATPSAADALLTTAPPAAFGFLSNNPATIALDASALTVPAGETLSLIGGNLETSAATGAVYLVAPGGRINIASVASPGEVVPNMDGEPADLAVDSFDQLGTIALANTLISTDGDGGGSVLIRGGRLTLAGNLGTAVNANTTGPVNTPLLGEPGAGIDVYVSGDMAIQLGVLRANVFPNVPVDSSGVRVTANSLEIVGPSAILTGTAFDSISGNAGDITVSTNSLLIRNGGQIQTSKGGSGNGGTITVNTGNLELRDNGYIYSNAYAGTGKGGDIVVNAKSVLLSNPASFFTGITAQTSGGIGQGGDVRVTTDSLRLVGGGVTEVSASTSGPGDAGDLSITVSGELSMSGSADNPFATGIFTNTWGVGNAGDLVITAGSLSFVDHARAQASTFGPGNAGTFTVRTDRLELREGSSIGASAVFGTGNGGNLKVTATDVMVVGIDASLDPANVDFTGFSTATNQGAGGNMLLVADNLQVSNKGQLTALSEGNGAAGNVDIELTGSLLVTDGGQINSSALAAGDGGNITVRAHDVTISGASPLGVSFDSAIGSQTNGSGNAGDVVVMTRHLDVGDWGFVTTDTTEAGAGGNIRVTAETLSLVGGSISAASTGTGIAGNIDLEIGTTFESVQGIVSAAANQADGGNITLGANKMVYLTDSSIETAVRGGAGAGGNITIDPQFVILKNSRISANAFGGPGGNISITAGSFIATPDSSITASSVQNIAGSIVLESPENDIAGSISQLPQSFLDAGALLPAVCSARRAEEQSSFVVARRGVAINPDGYLPTFHAISAVTATSRGAPGDIDTPPFGHAEVALASWGCR